MRELSKIKRKPNTKCIICDNPIYRRPFQLEKAKNNAFCSATCFGIFCRKETPCLVCGKLMLSRFNKKTCSRSCANKNRTGIIYKVNQPRDKVLIVNGLKIRLAERRGEKCELCSYSKVEILQLHHKNRNRNDNRMQNLELLCPNCHYEEHHYNHFKKH